MSSGHIDCACIAKVISEQVELRTSQKGTLWASFTAIVGAGTGDDGTFLRVSVFGDVARKLAGNIARGSKLYIEGSLRQSEYTTREGEKRTGLQVAASKCELLGIGRDKPKKSRAPHDEQRATNGEATAAQRDWQRPPAEDRIPF